MLEQIIEDRQIVRAITIYQQNPTAQGVLVDLVKRIEFERAQEEIESDHAE